jgi:hypothetical protein
MLQGAVHSPLAGPPAISEFDSAARQIRSLSQSSSASQGSARPGIGSGPAPAAPVVLALVFEVVTVAAVLIPPLPLLVLDVF